jgi:hypothetical protein
MAEILVVENDLERQLVKAHKKEVSFSQFLELFLISEIFVLSASEVMPDGTGLEPLLFDKQSVQMLGVFTALPKASLFEDKAPYFFTTNGKNLLKSLPHRCGLVVNPGYDIGFDLPPEGIQNILIDYSS